MKNIEFGTVVQFNEKAGMLRGVLGIVVGGQIHNLGQYGVIVTAIREEDGKPLNCLMNTKYFGDELEVVGKTRLIPRI